MPLPSPVPREPLHQRNIEMRAFRRADGLYDVEGRISDTKAHTFRPMDSNKVIPPGTLLHDMWVRLTIDEDMLVHDAAAVSDVTPYNVCKEASATLAKMKGAHIRAGWSGEIKRRLGGSKSCTHLMEMLIPLGSAAYQALVLVRMNRLPVMGPDAIPSKINSCYAYGSEREQVRRYWPMYYTPPQPASAEDEAAQPGVEGHSRRHHR